MIVGQGGRLQYEAIVFAASLRAHSPDFEGRLFVAEPQPGPAWDNDPRIRGDETRELLDRLGAEIIPFTSLHFGQSYPYGNKIEALFALPEGEPFVFFDTDTLVTGDITSVPFDFERPTASLRREGTWPKLELYGPGYAQIWKSLYDMFDLDFESSLDTTHPDGYWRRYLYFNAGWWYGNCPHEFGERFLRFAQSVRDDLPEELIGQKLDPWLDQIVLPLVIHGLGGKRDALSPGLLDGSVSYHYRTLPLFYAQAGSEMVAYLEETVEPNWIKKALKLHEPFKRMIYQNKGEKVRELFDQDNLPNKEQVIRQRIKKAGLWMR